MDAKEALVRALFDSENTARPDEHPEEIPAYIARAESLITWLAFHGYGLAAIYRERER